MKVALTILAGFAILAAILMIVGPSRVWALFGPADLGPVTFETLRRRASPNDALACPIGLCTARSDLTPPVFAFDVRGLRTAFAAVIASEPRVTLVATNDATQTERYIQRSALLGFPDTIVVRYIERPSGGSTLALYSRSQLGHGDLGVNKARIERWLAKLRR